MTERELFLAALDISDPGARQAYLDQACAGDARLRAGVDELLLVSSRATTFLKVPALKQLAGGAETSVERGEVELSRYLGPSTRPGALGRLAHYDVLEVLGTGGFGIVLKAFDEKLERIVAIKLLHPELSATSPPRKRFLREARLAAAVRDDHIVAIHAVEETPLPYIVMEFIPGWTLQQYTDDHGPLDVADALRIGRQIASGLAAAHAGGLIHRDVKPANILLESAPDRRARLTDFGLARATDDATLTQSGVVAGTPLFMAPEQAKGLPLDQRADLFSLGSLLYVMLTGRPPFRAPSTLAVLKRVCEDTPRPIRELAPEVPDWLCSIVARLQEKSPEDRFVSAREVSELLARCEEHVRQPHAVRLPEELQELTRRYFPDHAKTPPASSPSRLTSAAREWLEFAGLFAVILLLNAGALWWIHRYSNFADHRIQGVIGGAAAVATVFGWWMERRRSRSGAANAAKRWGRFAALACLFAASNGVLRLVSVRAVPQGTLTIESDAEMADILLNDRLVDVGSKRIVFDVEPGRQTVVLLREGKPASTMQVDVLANKRALIRFPTVTATESPSARPVPITDASPEVPWTPLFNGRDLTGWKTHPDEPGDWRVENGVLVGADRPAYLFSESDQYSDLDLRIEARVNDGGDSGMVVRAPFQKPGPLGLPGYEAQIQAGAPLVAGWSTGAIGGTFPGTGWRMLIPVPFRVEPDRWFTLEMRVRGAEVETRLNGQRVAWYVDPERNHTQGHIALQKSGGATRIEIRKLEIRTGESLEPINKSPIEAAPSKDSIPTTETKPNEPPPAQTEPANPSPVE
jgi:serine/threonine protein kinase